VRRLAIVIALAASAGCGGSDARVLADDAGLDECSTAHS
jgi:hypothetical protein